MRPGCRSMPPRTGGPVPRGSTTDGATATCPPAGPVLGVSVGLHRVLSLHRVALPAEATRTRLVGEGFRFARRRIN
jgi:hypothetical protein